MEAQFACEELRKVPSNFSCEAGKLFTQSDSETTPTKEEAAESIITKADNTHPNIIGQHKVRKNPWTLKVNSLGSVSLKTVEIKTNQEDQKNLN